MHILSILLSLLLTLSVSFADEGNSPNIHLVKRQVLTRPLYFSSIIQPIRSTNVTAPAEGVVTEKMFEYGQRVEKNQPLVKINSVKIETDYHNALKSYLQSKEEFFLKSGKFNEAKVLFDLEILSRDEFTQARSALNNANVTYLQSLYSLNEVIKTGQFVKEEITKLDISDIAAVEKALKVRYNFLEITALEDGVAMLPPESGNRGESAKLEVGSQVKFGEVISVIGDLSGLSLTVHVTEVDIRAVRLGQKALISGVAFPEFQLIGEVTHLDAQATSGNSGGGLPTFSVSIHVKNLTDAQRSALLVGMSAKVRLDIVSKGGIEVPIEAVIDRDGDSFVKKVMDDGDVEEIMVLTGQTSLDKVEILSGLEDGDEIVISD